MLRVLGLVLPPGRVRRLFLKEFKADAVGAPMPGRGVDAGRLASMLLLA